jgi:hypothetical protein
VRFSLVEKRAASRLFFLSNIGIEKDKRRQAWHNRATLARHDAIEQPALVEERV